MDCVFKLALHFYMSSVLVRALGFWCLKSGFLCVVQPELRLCIYFVPRNFNLLSHQLVTLLILPMWVSIIINCVLEMGHIQLFPMGFLQNHQPVVVQPLTLQSEAHLGVFVAILVHPLCKLINKMQRL